MNIQSIIVVAIIAVLFITAIKYILKNNDHCAGCGNKCSSSCPHCKA